ncbi:hypothetical protein RRF57_011933 [Xylaria bambusicola]|uniref:Uncharacterized protein n=1 Tax=Xylaria bambusicola TaxID=326684 RepID=A0AAN7V032_9PEZI
MAYALKNYSSLLREGDQGIPFRGGVRDSSSIFRLVCLKKARYGRSISAPPDRKGKTAASALANIMSYKMTEESYEHRSSISKDTRDNVSVEIDESGSVILILS